jgi:tellurite resistance protein TerC
VFAADSIPAVFSVTRDSFVAFSSNALAILGLRSLYFVVVGAVRSFRHMRPALAAVLAFVAIKMVLSPWFHVPVAPSLGVIAAILAIGLVASLLRARGSAVIEAVRAQGRELASPANVTILLVGLVLGVCLLLILAFELVLW